MGEQRMSQLITVAFVRSVELNKKPYHFKLFFISIVSCLPLLLLFLLLIIYILFELQYTPQSARHSICKKDTVPFSEELTSKSSRYVL